MVYVIVASPVYGQFENNADFETFFFIVITVDLKLKLQIFIQILKKSVVYE